ncbi:hypothetical protein P9112_007720 [Eukaryota sp. TZLM1-RC]
MSTLQIPFVHGCSSSALPKPKNSNTHRWQLYIRSHKVPLHLFVDKVIFYLHPQIPNPVREVTSSPFECTDLGWGEWSATIAVYVLGLDEPVLFNHFLKLVPYNVESISSPSSQSAVEQLDYILFQSPSPELRSKVENVLHSRAVDQLHPGLPNLYSMFNVSKVLNSIAKRKAKLENRLEAARNKTSKLEDQIHSESLAIEDLKQQLDSF